MIRTSSGGRFETISNLSEELPMARHDTNASRCCNTRDRECNRLRIEDKLSGEDDAKCIVSAASASHGNEHLILATYEPAAFLEYHKPQKCGDEDFFFLQSTYRTIILT